MVGQKLFNEKIQVPIQTATVIALAALIIGLLALGVAVAHHGA